MVSLNYEILDLYEDVNMKMLCEDFLASKDYLLFLLGDPGVGKSSILKYMMKY
jgi:DNA replicative helicase MCM subunit Mcm2 (Cdc46/Mcm family)